MMVFPSPRKMNLLLLKRLLLKTFQLLPIDVDKSIIVDEEHIVVEEHIIDEVICKLL
jgi:hypothetical protein